VYRKCYALGNLSGNVSDHEERPKLSDMDGELCDVLIVDLLENCVGILGKQHVETSVGNAKGI
jgi:hypothetical protein